MFLLDLKLPRKSVVTETLKTSRAPSAVLRFSLAVTVASRVKVRVPVKTGSEMALSHSAHALAQLEGGGGEVKDARLDVDGRLLVRLSDLPVKRHAGQVGLVVQRSSFDGASLVVLIRVYILFDGQVVGGVPVGREFVSDGERTRASEPESAVVTNGQTSCPSRCVTPTVTFETPASTPR